MEDKAEEPWVAPDWRDVAKASGTPVKPPEELGVVDTIKAKVMPWLADWKTIFQASEQQAPKAPQVSGKVTGDFRMPDYMSKLAKVESSNNPTAKASTSSALGLHQFTAGTWMDMVNKLDLPYTLKDRTDPEKSTEVATAFTRINMEKAQKDLGRSPSMAEAYLYHFIGKSAPRLIKAHPDDPAEKHVTAAQYRANKPTFEGKTVKEVLRTIERKFK